MDSQKGQICPWCQTEIVWDPEIGPEETCPHCLNELGGYRTIKFDLDHDGEGSDHGEHGDHAVSEDEDPEGTEDNDLAVDDSIGDYLDDYENEYHDEYAEKVTECIDTQEEAPECTNCHELMLLAGVRQIDGPNYTPVAPVPLGKPFLTAPIRIQLYVCPSCFKTDTYLAQEHRDAIVETFKSDTK